MPLLNSDYLAGPMYKTLYNTLYNTICDIIGHINVIKIYLGEKGVKKSLFRLYFD